MADVSNLDLERARKFLDRLSEDPFICLVITTGEEGAEGPQVRIYSKDMDAEQVGRIKAALQEIKEGN